ncbi:MAG: hypothetical protein RIG62_14295 [Cyclobacteriaceae bacterium]
MDLHLSDEQRLEIWGLLQQDLKMFAIKAVKNSTGLSLSDAKSAIQHLNKKFGHCNRCSFTNLSAENIACPKCKAFNYNWQINPSFNEEFCTHLEWKLNSDYLSGGNDRGYWCDGIDPFPNDFKSLSVKNLTISKEIKTKAWIEKDGQDSYDLVVKFGPKSMEKYIKSESLIACIPDECDKHWLRLDFENKYLEVLLK